MRGDWALQTLASLERVRSVSNQTVIPRESVKSAEATRSQACSLSQIRFEGMKNAGRVRRKVRKIKMALTMPAGGGGVSGSFLLLLGWDRGRLTG